MSASTAPVHAWSSATTRPAGPSHDPDADTAHGWRLIWESVRPHRPLATRSVVAGLLWSGGKVASPLVIAAAISQGNDGGGTAGIAVLIVLLAVTSVVVAVSAGRRRVGAETLAYAVEVDLRARIYGHALRMHQGFHDATPTGELISRTASDLQQVRQPIVNAPLTIANVAILVGTTVALVITDWLLAIVALAPTVAMVSVAARFRTRLNAPSSALQRALAGLSSAIEEAVDGIRSIKGIGAERGEVTRVGERTEATYRAAIEASRVRATYMPLLELLPAVGMAAVLWLGGDRAAGGEIPLSALVQFSYYLTMLVTPLRQTGQTIATLQRGLVSAALIDRFLRTAPEVVAPSRGRAPAARVGGAELRLTRVRFGYDAREPVLGPLDLHVHAGTSVAVVGASGSGKTTLAALIGRLYDVDEGSVTIDGVDVRELSAAELRRTVGVVFDDAFMFGGTIADNIAFAVPDATQEEIERAARTAGAHDFIVDLPAGYLTDVGARGLGLSGGQRHRVALARALLGRPRLLVLDDVMSAVDTLKEQQMRVSLQEVMRDRTVVLIAHRTATVAMADTVVLLRDGRIATAGRHGELMATSAAYREVLAGLPPLDDPDDLDDAVAVELR